MKLLNFEIKFFKKFTFDVFIFASKCDYYFIEFIQFHKKSKKKVLSIKIEMIMIMNNLIKDIFIAAH